MSLSCLQHQEGDKAAGSDVDAPDMFFHAAGALTAARSYA
jgi:hypothetical protein